MAARLKDHEHPFFRPLWRRVAVVAACAVWAAIEFATGSGGWAMIALGFTGYAVWQFFYLYKPAPPAGAEGEQPASPEHKE